MISSTSSIGKEEFGYRRSPFSISLIFHNILNPRLIQNRNNECLT